MPNSKRNAVRSERPTTVPPWLIALLAVLIGGALWMLFPKQALERRLADTADDSELSLNYLSNLLKSDPGNERLQGLLKAKQQRLEAMRQTAEEARKQALPSAAAQAWDRWQTLYQRYLEAKQQGHGSAGQAKQLAPAAIQALKAVPRNELSQEQSLYLASSALVLNDEPQALEIYEELVRKQVSPARKARVYEAAARQTLGLSMYQQSSRLWREASAAAQEVQQSRDYMWQALQVLQAGNRSKDALALAREQQELLGGDPETLRRLIGLARAAGDTAEAERYAKQLLKLSLLQQWQATAVADMGSGADDGAWALRPVLWNAPGWTLVHTAAPAKSQAPGLPFDDKTYELGYQVFLENRNLEDAWRVAAAAVHQAPGNMVWRERLAQVAEWSGRQQMALDNWLAIAQATQREAAWQSVMRLAPGLFDDRALVAGIKHELGRRPGDAALQLALVQAYERQAEPQPAIDYLQAHGSTPQAQILLAQLAERAGQPAVALKAWKRLLSDPAQRAPANVMPAAVLAFLQGERELGLGWLDDAQARVPAGMGGEAEAEYWRLLGDMAQKQQHEALALGAFRRLLEMPDATGRDFDEVINLLMRSNRGEAAQVSLRAWQQFHDPRHLSQALYMLEDLGEWSHAGRQIDPALADPKTAGLLLQQPAFLHAAALYYQHVGQGKKALELLQKGLALDSGSTLMRQSLLWLLIDTQNAALLAPLLAQAEPTWAQDPEMHDALAAAYMALSRPAVALQRYLRPHLQENGDDFLWMMSYADALEQNQQVDLAWRLRRELWLKQARQTLDAGAGSARGGKLRRWLSPEDLDAVQRQARNRLMLSQAHGDDELALLRELMRMDHEAGRELSAAAVELAIAWLQDKGEYSTERGYLWQQYALGRSKRANRPLWAEITVALAEKDHAQVGQLLEQYDASLSRYDRINAAALTGDGRLAQSAAFETQHDQPDDDSLHLALTEQLLAFSDHAGLQLHSRRLDGIDERAQRLSWHLALNPRWALDIDADHTRRSLNGRGFVAAPSSEHGVGLRLTRKTQGSSSEFMLGQRQSLDSYMPMQISHTQTLDSRLSLQASLGRNLPTQETLPMRMGGMKDRAALGATYRLSRLDELSLEYAHERFHVQTGARVGLGNQTTLQYTHSYRSEAPMLQFGAFTSWHRYSRNNPEGLNGRDAAVLRYLPPGNDAGIDYLLPGNFRFSGVQVSTNMPYAQEYSRALRPFASLALTHHSINGAGYDLSFGLATSVLGADHLLLGLNFSKSGVNTTGTTRELQLAYRLHY
ncbi:tetratricopeptide repeat protein [Comamonas guangdongensis]|uniref:Tetratricopeptide repeat protein n=1 Tax=Comamonas guangdongensis TaxID=510515 RepID=A0ABV3ZSD8_9BURK